MDYSQDIKRTVSANVSVVLISVTGDGETARPSRGPNGIYYHSSEFIIEKLLYSGSGDYSKTGLTLFPAPPKGAKRFFVFPREAGNWVPYSEEAERSISQAVAGAMLEP